MWCYFYLPLSPSIHFPSSNLFIPHVLFKIQRHLNICLSAWVISHLFQLTYFWCFIVCINRSPCFRLYSFVCPLFVHILPVLCFVQDKSAQKSNISFLNCKLYNIKQYAAFASGLMTQFLCRVSKFHFRGNATNQIQIHITVSTRSEPKNQLITSAILAYKQSRSDILPGAVGCGSGLVSNTCDFFFPADPFCLSKPKPAHLTKGKAHEWKREEWGEKSVRKRQLWR